MGRNAVRLLAVIGCAVMALSAGTATVAGDPARGWDARAVALSYFEQRQQQRGILPSVASNHATDVRESLGAVHVRVEHRLHGIPVPDAVSVVTLQPGDTAPRMVAGRGLQGQRVNARNASITASDAVAIAESAVGVVGPLRGPVQVDLNYAHFDGEYVLGYRVVVPASNPFGTWLVFVDATTGGVLSQRDVIAYDSGMVFDPNPFQSSGGTVPPPDDCDSAPNATTLAPHRVNVTLQGIAPAQNKLKGEYVDLTAPGILGAYKAAGLANEASRVYNYNCNDDRFEEVMVYHHIDSTQRKIQSLGFNGPYALLDHPIPAHAHFYADCNAHYDIIDKGLHFGDGVTPDCPPDAGEDGDIIVHEYGHALQDDAVPSWGLANDPNLIEQTIAMGEGFSDFFAAAIFGDSCLGGWGLFAGLCLRDTENPYVFPADFDSCPNLPQGIEEPHCAGEVWSGALWDLVQALGDDQAARDLVLRLTLNAHFYVSPLATFNEVAAAIVLSDQDLYGGSHVATINAVFNARGIPPAGVIFDPQYIYVIIRHDFPSDLEVRIKVGSTTSPTCNELLWDNNPSPFADLLLRGTSGCPGVPSVAVPWYLEVRDTLPTDAGTITEFTFAVPGSPTVCKADNLPLNVPDTNTFVYAVLTCQNQQSAQEFDTDGDTIPDIFEAQHSCMDQFVSDALLDYDADTLTNAAEFAAGTSPCAADTDTDNCNDNKELGPSPNLGGDRDPLSPWDFFDVPVPALSPSDSSGTRSGAVNLSDVLAILLYSGTSLGAPPNPAGLDYDSDLNANGIADGVEYDRSPSTVVGKAWRSGPPNNAVGLQDALVALSQSGHNCA